MTEKRKPRNGEGKAAKKASEALAEAELRKNLSGKEPMTREKALDVLSLFVRAGRVKKPSVGKGM